MPNLRQRRKNKSGRRVGKPTANGLRRLHNRMNKAPTLNGPLALQQGWDKHKTVRQKSVSFEVVNTTGNELTQSFLAVSCFVID